MPLAVAALAVVLWLAAVGSTSAAPTVNPTLRLVSLTPLTLRGGGFAPRERVRVTLTTRALLRHATVRANAAGAFRYRPAVLVAVEPCRGTILVRALGLRSGRTATWKRACRPPDEWPPLLVGRRAA